jgi:hypothetical protein
MAERQENTAGRHIPSIILAMVTLQVVLIIGSSGNAKKLPTARTELGIAATGFILLGLSRFVPEIASKLAWLVTVAAIFAHLSSSTPIINTITNGAKSPTPPTPEPTTPEPGSAHLGGAQ